MVTTIKTQGDITVISNSDWFSLVDHARDRKTDMPKEEQASRRIAKDPTKFFGTASFDEAYRLAERGDPELAKRVSLTGEAMYDYMSSLVIKPTPRFSDDPGITFDVSRLIEGDPEYNLHIDDVVKSGTGRSILRMVFNASADAGISTDVMMAKGATVAALAMLMEYSGFGVEIVVYTGIQESFNPINPGKRVEVYTTIKHADQAIHLLTLAYALAQPSTFRRLAFSLMEGLPEEIRKPLRIPGTYSYPAEASHKGDLYVGASRYGFHDWTDAAAARSWVIANLKEQGVALRD